MPHCNVRRNTGHCTAQGRGFGKELWGQIAVQAIS